MSLDDNSYDCDECGSMVLHDGIQHEPGCSHRAVNAPRRLARWLKEAEAALERERALADGLAARLEWFERRGENWDTGDTAALKAWREARKSVGRVVDGDDSAPALNKNPRGTTKT